VTTDDREAGRRPGHDAPRTDPTDRELSQEVARLRRRVAELEQPPTPPRGVRRVSAAILALLTVIAVVATTIAAWIHATALDTDRFMAVVEPVLEGPEVDAACAPA
jgi:hypothetical protein